MIDTLQDLRALYPQAKKRAVLKQLDSLDRHCRRFIELAPFVVIASAGKQGYLDASPRGGAPGFVKVRDARTLHIPDALVNNRLDSYTNIIETGQVGLYFLVPGVDETLRVNGTASLRDEAEIVGQFAGERHPPRIVVEVEVREAYLHCAKALMRSRLWDVATQVERAVLPSMGEMLREQTGSSEPVENQQEMLTRYAREL